MEEQLVKLAIQKYDSYMRDSTADDIFTDDQIIKMHVKATQALTSQKILDALPLNKNEADYINKITRRAAERVSVYIQSNKDEIKEQMRRRERLMADTKEVFAQVMSRYRGTVTASANQLHEFLETATTFAWEVYTMRARKLNIPHSQWKSTFMSQLDTIQKSHTPQSHSSSDSSPPSGSKTLTHERFMKIFTKMSNSASSSFTLSLYLDSTTVRGAVHKTEERSSLAFSKSWPFLIVFQGDKTLIPEGVTEAEAIKKGVVDLHKELTSPEQSNHSYPVTIRSQVERLKLEEILSMYFYKVKRGVETDLNVTFDSVTLVISPYSSTREKQVLKTSLSLAGFQGSVLVHSSTAAIVGMAFPHMDQPGDGAKEERLKGYVLSIQETGSHIQVCLASVTNTLVVLKALSRLEMSRDCSYEKVKEIIVKVLRKSKLKDNARLTLFIMKGPKSQTIDKESLVKFLTKHYDCHLLKEGNCDKTVLWGAFQYFQYTKFGTNVSDQIHNESSIGLKQFIEISKVSLLATENLSSSNALQYFNLKLNPAQKIHECVLRNKPPKSRTVFVSLGERKFKLFEVLNNYKIHCIASAAKTKGFHKQGLKIGFKISSEGLVEIIPPDSVIKKPASNAVEIQYLEYMSPAQVESSKEKLWEHYFKANKNKFEESWAKFCKTTLRLETGPKIVSRGDFEGGSSQDTKTEEEAGLQNALKELEMYETEVQKVLSSNSQSMINVRVLEIIRKDLRDCEPFLHASGSALKNIQARDVERQLTKLKISTQILNIEN